MHAYHTEAQRLLGHGDGPKYNPFTKGLTSVITDWQTSDPALRIPKPKHVLTLLDKAVDQAQIHAGKAPHFDKQILRAIGSQIKKVSVSTTGKQLLLTSTTGTPLQQRKARSSMKMIIYQSYKDGFGTPLA